MAVVATVTLLLWKCVEMTGDPSVFSIILERTQPLRLLYENPQHLLRMPFLYFGGLFVLGMTGLWSLRNTLPKYLAAFITTIITLCIIYFLGNEGWYRHILPAHILLLPFVPVGAIKIVGRKITTVMLLIFVLAQGWWQLTYHGSSKSIEAETSATLLHEQYANDQLIIRHSEIFVRYPNNPNWYFLPLPEIASYSPKHLTTKSEEMRCLPEVWKISKGLQEEYGKRLTSIHKRFVIIKPEDC